MNIRVFDTSSCQSLGKADALDVSVEYVWEPESLRDAGVLLDKQ